MGYILEIISKAEKEFLKLPISEQKKIHNKIISLEEHPRPFGSKKLRETEYFRIKSGDYRVAYSVNDENRVIKILSVAHRKDVYL